MARRWRRGSPGPDEHGWDVPGVDEVDGPERAASLQGGETRHPVFEGRSLALADRPGPARGGAVQLPSPVVEALARAAERADSSRRRRRRAARRAAAQALAAVAAASEDQAEDERATAPYVEHAGSRSAMENDTEALVMAPAAAMPAAPTALLPAPPSDSAEERAEHLLGSAAATAEVAPALESWPAAAADEQSEQRQRRRAAAWLTSTQAAAAVILLLGAGVGFVVYKAASPASHQALAPQFPPLRDGPVVTVPATTPLVTVPPATAPNSATTVPPTTVPAGAPQPATAPASLAAAPVTTVPAPLPCTANDLAVSSSSDRSSYAAGQVVSMVTTITARHTCVYQPVPSQYSCAASIVVKSAGGGQAWPWQGQSEDCSAPPATTLQAGSTESIVASWNGQVATSTGAQNAPPGSYAVVGTWSWSSGPGQPPVVVSVASPAFTIS